MFIERLDRICSNKNTEEHVAKDYDDQNQTQWDPFS